MSPWCLGKDLLMVCNSEFENKVKVLCMTDSQIAYRIFSVYQKNTKTIHLIMMIWLVSFIISNYKLASGPPKDPGGVKKIFSKSKGH